MTSSTRNGLVREGGVDYQTGFGNAFESECLKGALPKGRNNPRLVPYNLYAEQLSGTAFTAPRQENRRTWLYRIQPSVVVGMAETSEGFFGGVKPSECQPTVDPLRWKPPQALANNALVDFVQGMQLVCTAGEPSVKSGLAIYIYQCNISMKDRHLVNADGDFLVVPQEGALQIITEVGVLRAQPTEIVVLPRGMVFSVQILQDNARGYVLEVYSNHFQLPELGPIGSNGLVNARDVYYPTARCVTTVDKYQQPCTILCKMHSQIYPKPSSHSPYNVVAWHGNYLPFKYDLTKFCAVNSVTYDHLDPSIYTVLTCPSEHPGTALADFVIFPPRVMATDSNTLRPPWFHRNTMSEFMGLIQGQYDAKQGGFVPGGASLHNCMVPHGPDAQSYQKAVVDECLEPTRFEGGLAFMFETCLSLRVAPQALTNPSWRDVSYAECWQELSPDSFTGWDLLAAKTIEEDRHQE